MFPPHIHIHLSPPEITGIPPNKQVGLAGIQGATIAGTQGIGVKTPRAAAVAAATVGLERVLHIPNVEIFTIGMKSVIVATDNPAANTGNLGSTANDTGATPNEQEHKAPQTAIGILI